MKMISDSGFLVLLIGLSAVSGLPSRDGALAVRSARSVEVVEPKEWEPAPESLHIPMNVIGRTLMGGGPTNPYPKVLVALSMALTGVLLDPTFLGLVEEVKAGLRYVFQTKNNWTLPLPGSGNNAIETVLANLLEPGDVLLVPVIGMWGARVTDMAERIGAVVKNIHKPLGSTCTFKDFEEAVILHKPKVLYVVHGESSTGVRQSLAGLGDLCRKHDCILAVDTVGTIVSDPVLVDEWKIDVSFCNTQKAIGSIASFAPVTFGPRAIAVIKNRKTPVKTFLNDMNKLAVHWACDEYTTRRAYHSTLPVVQLYALREALSLIAAEGLAKAWERHAEAHRLMSEGLAELKLEHFVPDPKDRLTATVTVNPPPAMADYYQKLLKFALDKYNIEFTAGLGPTAGKVIRIGIMGLNANTVPVAMALKSLKEGLEQA